MCKQKGPERAVGGQCGLACTVMSNELEPVAVVVERPVVSLSLLNKLALFFNFKVFSLPFVSCSCGFETFAGCELIIMQRLTFET